MQSDLPILDLCIRNIWAYYSLKNAAIDVDRASLELLPGGAGVPSNRCGIGCGIAVIASFVTGIWTKFAPISLAWDRSARDRSTLNRYAPCSLSGCGDGFDQAPNLICRLSTSPAVSRVDVRDCHSCSSSDVLNSCASDSSPGRALVR